MEDRIQVAISDFKAVIKLILQRTKKRKSGPIRVGFMGQYIPAWNKVESIYQAMLSDDRFEPVVICVPSEISEHQLKNPDSLDNDTYEYYKNGGYKAINALIGKNQWLDLESLDLDYVFYLRPYNYHMPIQYASGVVSRYAKVCVVLYGMIMVEEDIDTCLKHDFFCNVYCYFAESEYVATVNRERFKLSHLFGLQKSIYYGNPAMSQVMDERDKPTSAWDEISGEFKIMWTPRWTTDLKLGGTNFFNYKDWILDFAKANPKVSVMLRPHPLAFANFVKAGDMTQQEADSYKAICHELANVEIDSRKDYLTTMWKSDVLIGDISGILPEYFIMNKPLIFCASNMILHPTEFTKRMFEGCYIVNNKAELEECLTSIMNGIDPLKEKRQEIINELFTNKLETCVSDILNELEKGI